SRDDARRLQAHGSAPPRKVRRRLTTTCKPAHGRIGTRHVHFTKLSHSLEQEPCDDGECPECSRFVPCLLSAPLFSAVARRPQTRPSLTKRPERNRGESPGKKQELAEFPCISV